MSDIYNTLNPQQQEAVYHTEGPLLILASFRFVQGNIIKKHFKITGSLVIIACITIDMGSYSCPT